MRLFANIFIGIQFVKLFVRINFVYLLIYNLFKIKIFIVVSNSFIVNSYQFVYSFTGIFFSFCVSMLSSILIKHVYSFI